MPSPPSYRPGTSQRRGSLPAQSLLVSNPGKDSTADVAASDAAVSPRGWFKRASLKLKGGFTNLINGMCTPTPLNLPHYGYRLPFHNNFYTFFHQTLEHSFSFVEVQGAAAAVPYLFTSTIRVLGTCLAIVHHGCVRAPAPAPQHSHTSTYLHIPAHQHTSTHQQAKFNIRLQYSAV